MTESKNTLQRDSFNVLLIGDSCIDEYKIGTIDRLSPEAPVPVIKLVETTTVPGMASNVQKNFENGTIFFDQVLQVVLFKYDQTKRDQLKLLSQNDKIQING